MQYKDAAIQMKLTYTNYHNSLADSPVHEAIIETVRQYMLDAQHFVDRDVLHQRAYRIASELYLQERGITDYVENKRVLVIFLATYCVRYIIETTTLGE